MSDLNQNYETKRGKEIMKEINYKEKFQICSEFYHMKQFAIFAFCIKKGIDPLEYLEFQYEIYDKLKYSKMKNPVILAAAKKLPKNFMITQFQNQIFKNWQPFQDLKDFTLKMGNKWSQIELKKCRFRKIARKFSKKTGISIPDDLSCKFCKIVYSQGEEYGFDVEIKPTENGCTITLKGDLS